MMSYDSTMLLDYCFFYHNHMHTRWATKQLQKWSMIILYKYLTCDVDYHITVSGTQWMYTLHNHHIMGVPLTPDSPDNDQHIIDGYHKCNKRVLQECTHHLHGDKLNKRFFSSKGIASNSRMKENKSFWLISHHHKLREWSVTHCD